MVSNKSTAESLIDGLSDHETLLLVRQDIKTLKESQADFHKEVRQNFEDLKNNYSSTLAKHERDIIDLMATRADFRAKIEMVKQDIGNSTGYFKWVLALVAVLIGLISWHIIGYRI